MLLAEVVGNVVATVKDEGLSARKLLVLPDHVPADASIVGKIDEINGGAP